MTILKELRSFPPAAFFEMRLSIPRGDSKNPFKKRGDFLPSGALLTAEKQDVGLALVWTSQGLFAQVKIKLPLENGDLLEIFIDTRDLKTCHVMTAFCHHFLFDPIKEEGREISRFRGEDRHPLADPSLFFVKMLPKERGYRLQIGMPKEVLHGYNPSEFKRIGFTYRLQKKNGEKRHLYLSSDFFSIERHPSLWTSLRLSEEME